MKTITITLFVFIFIKLSFSQTDSLNSKINLLIIPTVDEMKDVFTQAAKGELDAASIFHKLAEKSDTVVAPLEEFLFTEYKDSDTSVTINKNPDSFQENVSSLVKEVKPNKPLAVLALDAIGTSSSIKALLHAAVSHPDSEVKGTALKVLAWNSYYRAKNDRLKPDKEIVHVLINNVDDTTYVKSLGKTIGDIAREGIKNWTGEDYGNIPKDKKALNVKMDNVEISMKDYREAKWQEDVYKYVWSKNELRFVKK